MLLVADGTGGYEAAEFVVELAVSFVGRHAQ